MSVWRIQMRLGDKIVDTPIIPSGEWIFLHPLPIDYSPTFSLFLFQFVPYCLYRKTFVFHVFSFILFSPLSSLLLLISSMATPCNFIFLLDSDWDFFLFIIRDEMRHNVIGLLLVWRPLQLFSFVVLEKNSRHVKNGAVHQFRV